MSALWLERLRIDGFGQLSGIELRLSRGLNVLYGENEAGKSTILAFVRAMLFGFAPRSHPERYEPEHGPYGGELTLMTPHGPWTIRRVRGRTVGGEVAIRGPGERTISEAQLQTELGVERAVFQQIFAFGLGELASFEALSRERSVSDALSASATPGARRLPEAIARLEKRCGELFTVRGTKSAINAMIAELKSVQERIAALGDVPRQYGELLERARELDRGAADADAEVRGMEGELRRVERLVRAAPELERLAQLERKLATIPERIGFPEAAAERLADLEARQQRHRDACRSLEEKVQALDAELEALDRARLGRRLAREERPSIRSTQSEPRASSAERSDGDGGRSGASDTAVVEARAALAAVTAHLPRMREEPSRAEALRGREAELNAQVEALGIAGGLSALAKRDLSPAARTEVQELRTAWTASLAEQQRCEQRVRSLSSALDRLHDDSAALERELAQVPVVSGAQLKERELAVARLIPLRLERAAATERIRELEQRLASPRRELARPVLALSLAVAIAGALLFAALGAGALLVAAPRVGAVALGAAAVLGALLVLVQRRLQTGHDAAVQLWESEEAARGAELERARGELARLGEQRTRVGQELAHAAQVAGLSPDADALAVGRVQQQIAEAIRAEQRRSELATRLAAAERERTRAQRELELAEGEAAQASGPVRALRERFDGWLVSRGFPSGLAVELAIDRVLAAAALQDRARTLERDQVAFDRERAELARVRTTLMDVGCGWGIRTADPIACAAELERATSAHEARTRESARLQAQRSATAEALARAAKELEQVDGAIRALLGAGDADSGAVLRAREQEQLTRRVLVREASEWAQRVRGVLAAYAPEEARRDIEALGGPGALQVRHSELVARLAAARQQRDVRVDERGQVRAQLSALENGDAMRGLRLEEERLSARLADRARAYAVERAALALLEQERVRHREAHQPKLLSDSSAIFSRLTGGRYLRVLAPEAEREPLKVRRADGQELSAELISRGTREQLYLAFRLAVVAGLAEQRAALPLIVDDVLVNFDPARARRAVAEFAALSSTHQVLAFTCHPGMRDLFAEHQAELAVLSSSQPLHLRANAG